jgi:outer membrane protein OmpA-like peptidoglycan-associated protein
LLPCSLSFGILGDDAGTSALPLLRSSAGPRASAMGECFVGLADDATGIFWNPAGLGQSHNTEFFLSHQEWFQGIRDEYASVALAAGGGRLGIGLIYSGTSDIEAWDANNMPTGSYGTHTGIGSVGYGHVLGDKYFLGGNAKLLYDRLGETNGYGGCLDLGMLARPWSFLNVGVSFQHLGWGMYYTNGWYRLPMTCRAGLAVHRGGFRLMTEAELPLWASPSFHVGGEFSPFRAVAFRAGYRTGPQDIMTLGAMSGLSAGLGINLGWFSLDYAYAPYGKLGQVHRLGIRTRSTPRGFGVVRVRVMEAGTPYGLPAAVDFSGLRALSRRADDYGKLELGKLTEGWLKIDADMPGYVPGQESIYVKGDREQTVTLLLCKQGTGTIWGMLMDVKTRKMLAGRVLYRQIAGAGPEMASGELEVKSRDASYSLRGIMPGAYVLRAFGPSGDYLPQTCTVAVETSMVVSHDFLFKSKASATLSLSGIMFDSSRSEIRPADYARLDVVGRTLQENPGMVIELGGYADPLEEGGYQSENSWTLAEARAAIVQKYLMAKFGIAQSRLQIQGYADLYPTADNSTPEGRALNRRVELFVIKE